MTFKCGSQRPRVPEGEDYGGQQRHLSHTLRGISVAYSTTHRETYDRLNFVIILLAVVLRRLATMWSGFLADSMHYGSFWVMCKLENALKKNTHTQRNTSHDVVRLSLCSRFSWVLSSCVPVDRKRVSSVITLLLGCWVLTDQSQTTFIGRMFVIPSEWTGLFFFFLKGASCRMSVMLSSDQDWSP